MSKATTITLGPVTITPAISVGFTAFGFVWAVVVNLIRFGGGVLAQPEALSTLTFWGFALTAVWLLQGLGERFDSVLDRLWNRGVLAMTEKELGAFKREVQAKTRIFAAAGGIFMFLLVVIFYLASYFTSAKSPALGSLVQYPFEAGACFIGGLYMGRTIVHAFVGNLLQRRRFKLTIILGHPDGAAGVTPIGELFLRQAAVMLLPAVYFAIGWAVMTVAKHSDAAIFENWKVIFDEWASIFLLLFLVIMAVQLAGFLAPMWLFHVDMVKQKREQLVVADRLSSRIAELKTRLADEDDESEMGILKERLSEMMARHDEIENLPSWPVGSVVRQRFAMGNLLVSAPVLLGVGLEIYKLFSD